MNKPIFIVVDSKGKILIPQSLRQFLDVDKGDTVSLAAENGRIVVKKAIVPEDQKMPRELKYYYAQAAVSESDNMDPADQLKLIAKLIRDLE